MTPLSKSLKQAIRIWRSAGMELFPPADHEQIQAVMDQIGQRASADVFELYETTGGFAGDTDEHLWYFWSLDHIRQENVAINRPQWAFSDGMLDSFLFRLKYDNELVSSVWIDHGTDATYPVAKSLAEFFGLYLSDPGRIGLP
jgi:hypothetical protein